MVPWDKIFKEPGTLYSETLGQDIQRPWDKIFRDPGIKDSETLGQDI